MSKVFTAVTQFAANGGKLSQITRKYIQNGRQISGGGTILSCGSEGSTGGMTGMGQGLKTGSKRRPRILPKFLGKTVGY
jgi:cellulase